MLSEKKCQKETSEDTEISEYGNPIPTYKAISKIQAKEKMQELIFEVKDLLCVSEDEALILLLHFKWNFSKLKQNWFEKEGDKKIKEKCGLDFEADPTRNCNKDRACQICFNPLDKISCITLKCNHYFCLQCFQDYLSEELVKGGKALFTTCPMIGCRYQIEKSYFMKFLHNKIDVITYSNLIWNSFSMQNKYIRSCTKSSCTMAIESFLPLNNKVECKCGNVFCPICLDIYHSPASCKMLKKWKMNFYDGKVALDWKKKNLRLCPFCGKTIEKNEGCNRMNCSFCQNQFCCVCMTEWKGHNSSYRCNKVFNETTQIEEYDDVFLNPFRNHDKAMIDLKVWKEESVGVFSFLMEMGIISTDIEFFEKAYKVIYEAHRTLMYSSVVSYFLEKNKEIEFMVIWTNKLEVICEKATEQFKYPKKNFLSEFDIVQELFYSYQMDLIEVCNSLNNKIVEFNSEIISKVPFAII